MSKLNRQIKVLQECALVYFLISGTVPQTLVEDIYYLQSKVRI